MVLAQKIDISINGTGRKAENKPIHCGKVVYEKGEKNTQWTKVNLFNKW